MVIRKPAIPGDDLHSKRCSRCPHIMFILEEVELLLVFSFEIEVEPLKEFTLLNEEVVHPVLINRGEKNDCNLIISEINLLLDLFKHIFCSLNIMNLQSLLRFELERDHILLFLKISHFFLPSFNLFEDCLYVIDWILYSCLTIYEFFQVIYNLFMAQFVLWSYCIDELLILNWLNRLICIFSTWSLCKGARYLSKLGRVSIKLSCKFDCLDEFTLFDDSISIDVKRTD